MAIKETMTRLPGTFKVTEDHRNYCAEKWGYPNLPDVLLRDFVECFTENGKRHKNWNTTFKAYIRNNSPEGRFYSRDYWERCVVAAKKRQYGDRQRQPAPYHPKQLEAVPATPQVAELARKRLRELLA